MSRYIVADALITDLNKGLWGKDWDKVLAEAIINEAPSIDLVRCVECRKVREDGGHANCNGYLYCRKWKTLVDEDGYCSYGQKGDENVETD